MPSKVSVEVRDRKSSHTHRRGEAVWRQRQRSQWCGHNQKNAGGHQRLQEAKTDSHLGPLEGGQPDKHLNVCPGRLMSNFWPSEPREKKFLLFKATKFVGICYNNHRKLIQGQKKLMPLLSEQSGKVRGSYLRKMVSIHTIKYKRSCKKLVYWNTVVRT